MIFLLLGLFANAQVSMTTTGSYFQNFDGLGITAGTWTDNTTLPNWWANRTGTGTTFAVSDGSATAGTVYSFGTTSAADRALGTIGSGGATAGNFSYGVQLQNNSGVAITQLTISYIGEQWRDGGSATPAAQIDSFSYKISATMMTTTEPATNVGWTQVPALNFTSPTFVNSAGTALDGNAAANRVYFNNISIPSLSIPAGSYIMLKWKDINHNGNDHGLAIDSLTVAWVVAGTNSVTTGAISGTPFCVTASTGASVSVPFTISGTYNAGNVFTAYLSDAAGSFASETAIGTLNSQLAGTISATIPAGTAAGTGYRIRVKASDPVATGTDNGSNLTIVLGVPTVSSPSAVPGNNSVDLSWTNPVNCYDELMIVAKPTTSITALATGDGTAYTANSTLFTDVLNTVFDGTGAVVYKSATPATSATITGLTNSTQYFFRIFVRKGTEWNNATEVSATPTSSDVIPPVATSAYASSLSNVVVVFNEALDQTSAETTSHYTFLAAATGSASLRPTNDSVFLTLSTPLSAGVTDTLRVTGISDINTNVMSLTYKFPVTFGTLPVSDRDTLVFWNFPNNPDNNIADGGITANLSKVILREPGFADTNSYSSGATTRAVSTTKWDFGTFTKYWEVEFTTWLYDSIRFSSKQRSSGSGPRNFRVEYSLDGSTWTAVAGAKVLCADNFTSGVLSNINLPAACNSQPSVRLRWILTSDSAVNAATYDSVRPTGTSRMDDLYVTGRYNPILGVDCNNGQALEFAVYPNPATESVTIQLQRNASVKVEIISITGKLMRSELLEGNQFRMDVSDLTSGLYMIRMTNTIDKSVSVKKLSVK